jgi:hypothetical protein
VETSTEPTNCTHVLAVLRSYITEVTQLPRKDIVIACPKEYNAWLLFTLQKNGIYPYEVRLIDILPAAYNAVLLADIVDAVLVDVHPNNSISAGVALNKVRLLHWRTSSITQAVDKFQPDLVESTLPQHTYGDEQRRIKGYAPAGSAKDAELPAPFPLRPVTEYWKISSFMGPGGAVGRSKTYVAPLGAGQDIRIFAQLENMEVITTMDYSYLWKIELLDQYQEVVQTWEGDWNADNIISFTTTTETAGDYYIRITHYSNYDKVLYLEAAPLLWFLDRS